MKNKMIFSISLFVIVAATATSTWATPTIKVLVAKNTAFVSDSTAQLAIIKANITMNNSGLPTHDFVNVDGSRVYIVNCPGDNSQALLLCVRQQLESTRNQLGADVVLTVAAFLDERGAIVADMIDAVDISSSNENLAYVIVRETIVVNPPIGIQISSHELGHSLSLEHVQDNNATFPVGFPFNHAAKDNNDLTVMGNEIGFGGDCPFTSCTIANFYSENGKTFSNGGSAGDSTYANARKVVNDKSWNVVSSYRPFQGNACSLVIEFIGCNAYGNKPRMLVTANTGGVAGTILDILLESKIGSGNWDAFYEGQPTCPVVFGEFNIGNYFRAFIHTSIGTSYCEKIVVPPNNCNPF